MPKVAFEVCNRINAATPVTPAAMLTFALLDNGDRAITVEEGGTSCSLCWTTSVCETAFDRTGQSRRARPLRDTLRNLVQEGVVTQYDGPTERVFYVSLDSQHEAAFTATPSSTSSSTGRSPNSQRSRRPRIGPRTSVAVWENARRLKDILKFEFFFPPTREFSDQIAAEASLMYPGWGRTPSPPSVIEEAGKSWCSPTV